MTLRSALFGLLAASGLMGFYSVVLTLVSGWGFTTSQAARDWPYLAAIVPLFGLQVGLYHFLRSGAALHTGGVASAGASGGMSGTAMVACCAHFLPALLPYVGVAAFATILAAWRTPMLLLAIAANVMGVGVAVRAVRANARHAAMHEHHAG